MRSERFCKGLYPAMALLTLLFVVAASSLPASAQTTIQTGSISGTVTDNSGAVVPDAQVIITNKATNQKIPTKTNSAGAYQSGALIPGDYIIHIEKQGFRAVEMPVTVLVGTTSNGNLRLQPGEVKEIITVEASSLQVNTQQATVQGVLNLQQIEQLPINGRNFLDLAQTEPGVQIQEGGTFDPTKNGFSSISFGSRFGRTARIEVDGVDISDETVGTTTQNIPASAIQEFSLAQSSLDLSTELTSSGAVSVTTRSGTNAIHGEGFGYIRDSSFAASLPASTPAPFQRTQYGGNLGGPLIKDKLFWFVDAEHNHQNLASPQSWNAPFDIFNGNLSEPFRELMTMGRLDWTISQSARMFYRFSYNQNSDARPFGSFASFQPFVNLDNTPSHAVGVDFNTGSFTHSIRFEYLKFRNAIGDATANITGPENPVPGIGLNIGAPAALCIFGGGGFCSGPNLLAPQATFQSDHQAKYDGSKIIGAHTLRYGVMFNHIQGGGFASFFTFPQVATLSSNPGQSDPTSYTADFVFLGNGSGFATDAPAFGFPAGGQGPDNRLQLYFGDSWRLKPNFTLTAGVRYVRDTGRTDSNLGAIPALNQFGAGLGDAVRNPNLNFAPYLGFAWDITGKGKTVLRAGGGLYYENSIWNNIFFDAPLRLQQGVLLASPLVCAFGGQASPINWPSDPGAPGTPIAGGAGTVLTESANSGTVGANFCGGTISAVAPQILALSNAYQAATVAAGAVQSPNPNFIGNTLTSAGTGDSMFAPNYRTPRSWQMNVGIQHEFKPGLLLTVDYIRNIGEHYLLSIDVNHSGDASTFNQANAIAARDAAQLANGCAAGAGQGACMVGALGQGGAQAAYSAAGLDSNVTTTGGGPCNFCAFPGLNDNLGQLSMLFPIGRSVYNGMDVKLQDNVRNPIRGVKNLSLQLSYSLSRFVSQVQDQDFVNNAVDFNNPLRFTGPNALDRTHQLSFFAVLDLPLWTRLSFVGHFFSPLPQNIALPQLTSGGEIFATDWTGDGTVGDLVPGTTIGNFQRGVDVGGLQGLVNNYNSTQAGTLTPAGQAVVNSGVMTLADMQALGWVMPTLPANAPGAMNFPWLKTFDLMAAWPIKVGERVTVQPSVGFFNVFNLTNAFLPGNLPTAALDGSASSIGQVGFAQLLPFRAGMQSGVYSLGAPRQIEFGLKITF